MKEVNRAFGKRAVWLATSCAAILLMGNISSEAAVFDYSGQLEDVLLTTEGSKVTYRVVDPTRERGRNNGYISEEELIGPSAEPILKDGVVYWTDGFRVYARIYDCNAGEWKKTDVVAGGATDLISRSGIVTWISSGFVYLTVYDCTREEWMNDRVAFSGTPTGLMTYGGIVAWQNQTAAFYAAYDPIRGEWVHDNKSSGAPPMELDVQDGVVYWHNTETVFMRVYDPMDGGDWRGKKITSGRVSQLQSHGGTVAWSSSSKVYYNVYDPLKSEWASGNKDAGFTTNLTVSAGTVRWTSGEPGEDDFIRGYDYETEEWVPAITRPLAFCVRSSSSGPLPLKVYFIDMSLGASGWGWSFGDDTMSFKRSPLHIYRSSGIYIATLAVTGPKDRGASRAMPIFAGAIDLGFGGGGASLEAPRLTAGDAHMVAEGVFQASIVGKVGHLMVIEKSDDMVHWQAITTLTNQSGTVEFVDGTADSSRRYYRVRTMEQ